MWPFRKQTIVRQAPEITKVPIPKFNVGDFVTWKPLSPNMGMVKEVSCWNIGFMSMEPRREPRYKIQIFDSVGAPHDVLMDESQLEIVEQ